MSRHRATLFVLIFSFTILSFSSQAWGQSPLLEFLDEHGTVTTTYVEGSRVFLRLRDGGFNQPGVVDDVPVLLTTSRAGDMEYVTMTETGPSTGVFLGSIDLAPGSASQPGVLETAADPDPPHDRDTILARHDSNAATATASMTGSAVWFLDGDGLVRPSFAVGERIHVRVADSLRNDPATLTSFQITVAAPATGEQEVIYVQETGLDTGIFEGSVATANGFSPSGDGALGTSPGQAVEAVHLDADLPTSSRADAVMITSRVELVDSQGRPAEYYLESSRVYVQVLDNVSGSAGVPDTVTVSLQADISGDQELLTLQETGPATGIYKGSMELRRGPGLQGSGTLETHIDGPPYLFDTVRAASGSSTDAVGMIGSLTSFVDAYGNDAAAYPVGVAVRVRVEDHNFNDPGRFDTVGVTVTSLTTGDAEGLSLLEVAKNSGIFEGALPTQRNAPASPSDGYLQVQVGEEAQAMHVDSNGVLASGDQARIEFASISFVDEAGRPTEVLLENAMARVRVISLDGNSNPGVVDGLLVQLRSLHTGDQEELPLAETGPDTSIFEGTILISYFFSAQPGNGSLETDNPPPYSGDEVTASYGPFSDTARTVGALVVFIDRFGRETTEFPIGSPVRVRVTDFSRGSPTIVDTLYITLSACANDVESFQLTETGFTTRVFEGEIPSSSQLGSPHDGTLQGAESCLIRAFYNNSNNPGTVEVHAVFTGGEVLFVDAQGQPASVFLEGTRAYLRVVDADRSGTVQVDVRADLSGDQELVTLSETAPGVFAGSIELRSESSGFPQNGTLETSQASGPPHEFETLRAVYADPSGDSTATASTLNFRVWFIDAFGSVTASYAQGSRVYVRMESHSFNDPGQFDRLGVTLRTSRGDEEPLLLLETGKTTGIYEGSIDLDGAGSPSFGDGRLQAGPGDELEGRFDPQFNAAPARARIEFAAVSFIDEAGAPTMELLENGLARVRVISPDNNGSPGQVDGLLVHVRTLYAGDDEELPLAETGPDTGVFEGSIQLSFNFSGSQGNGVLETANQGPELLGEQVTASYGPFSATARTIGARVVFIDGFGRETTAFPLGSPVRVRVTDPSRNTPQTRETAFVTLTACQSDQESFELTETGFNTGVFEGGIPSAAQSVSSHDGTLQGTELCVIRAFYNNPNSPTTTEAQAVFTGGEVLFVDAQGQPASVFLEGTRAYLRVVDSGRSGTVGVDVTSELSGDQELVTLQERTPGVFEGSIELRSESSGFPQNGTLETSQASGPPHEFETLRAVYEDPSGFFTATASTLNFRIWFLDAYGSVTASYAQGSRVYVRLESHNFNDPGHFDRLGVTLRTSRGDEEPLLLLETGKTTGIYEGSIDLDGAGSPSFGDGRLQAGPGDELDARFDPQFNASPAKARVEFAAVSFIDEAGAPTMELLENGLARVRVISPDNNGSPGQVDGLLVHVRTLYAGDDEELPLAETGPDTGVFEGSIQLSFNFSGSQGNGALETANQGPEFPGEQVTASYGPFSATARTIGARVVFIDGFGRETTAFPLGSPVRVRVTDASRNTPQTRETAFVTLTACQNDQESFELTETGFNTGVFEGGIPSAAQSVSSHDGTLQGTEPCVIRAFYNNPNSPTTTEAQAVFTGGEVLFVDAQGQPASVFLEGTRAYLRVVDPARSGTVQVDVTAELSGDLESVTLQERSSGVFEGSIELRSESSGFPQNGRLETSQASGPPHEFETLRAVYEDPSGFFTATASTLNFRIWFIDAYGSVTSSYAQGSRVYVRMESHNFNDPGHFDRLGVTLRTSRGDEEPLLLLETGKTTGIYEGSVDLDGAGSPSFGDGRLQAGPGDELDARFDPQFNASPAKARVENATVSFIDEAGAPTMELLENGLARVRVISPDNNGNPGQVDGLLVHVRTLYAGDDEELPLAETGPDTGVFEGSIQLSFNFSGSQGNGVLETANQGPEFPGEQVTASYGPFSATARTIGARVVFIDGFGRETTGFPLGSPVRVRVTDASRNTPQTRETAFVTLTACQSDQESFELTETGFNTGVFEGGIPSAAQSVSSHDGTLQGTELCVIRAFYNNPNSPTTTEAQAVFTGGEVLFVDAQGQPASVFLEGTRAYLRVVDPARSSSSVSVTVTAELSGDLESVTLQATAPGVFGGSVELRSESSGFPQNGTLETSQASGPPHEFETLRAVYEDPSGSSTATASTLNFRIWFIDAYGSVTSSYAQGSRVYVRMESHNFNDPGHFDRVGVTLRTSRGDEEPLLLLETGKTTGIYEGSVDLDGAGSPSFGDGRLQAGPGDELEARFDPQFNASPAKARVENAAISFIDEAGVPTVELLENGTARVRVISPDNNGNPGQADGLLVHVRTFYAGDDEELPLAETGPDTGVFEGSIQLSFNFSGSQGNGVLETANQGPEFPGEQVTASYGPFSATARTIGARVVFIDGFGRETTEFPLGSPVRVRVTDASRNTPQTRETAFVTLTACQSDQESFELTETGFNTGVFEGGIPSAAQSVSSHDGTLQGTELCVIRAFYNNPNSPTTTEAQAVFTGGEVLFVDAQGQPASVFLEGTRAYLRVVDPARSSSSVSVTVTAELSGDLESVTLQATAPGVFGGSIELRSESSGFPQNGRLETSQASGPPHEFETLRAVYEDPSGSSTATASTLNFRVWFIDAYGSVTASYAQGSRVYVRMESHNFNDPGHFDRVFVTLRTSRGDEEPLQLLETGKTTGIYEGSIDLDGAGSPSFGDGRVQAGPGDELEARFDPQFNASPAKARVENAAISFIDEAGVPTVELLENGTARVRVISPDNNGNPGQADGLLARVQTFYAGDDEELSLAETGPDTGVFEGSIRLSFNFSGSQGNGVLETATQGPEFPGEQVTASYGPFSATARTIGARVVFIDSFGRETTELPLGSPVRVRVTDASRNTPQTRETAFVTLIACQNDQESFELTETGFNTGVFEGGIPSAAQSVSFNDGTLQGTELCVIRAFYNNPNAPTTTEAQAVFTGGEVLFVDAEGQPASVFLEGTRAYLRVVDPARSSSSVSVTVTAELSGDLESVTLQATAPGVFGGSIELRSESSGFPQNGRLETSQASGPPHEFETLRAVYEDPSGSSTATASTLNFRIWFIDAFGSVTATYPQRTRVYVRMEDHNFNDPGQFDRVFVTVRTSRGDEESLQLLETGKATAIFEGSIDLDGANPPSLSDGRLQAGPGDELDARFDPQFNASPAKARVENAAISFIDEAGAPTVELLENSTARVRVISPDNNGDPGQADGLLVLLRALSSPDQEEMVLTETGPDTGVFEGSIPLSFTTGVVLGNGTLETTNQGPPEYLGEEVTASFGPFSATAHLVGSRLVFIDGFGRETTTFPLGSPVRVRVTNPSLNGPGGLEEGYLTVSACQNDQESISIFETGYNTGVFEGEIPSSSQAVTLNDAILQGTESCLIRAFYNNPNAPTVTEAQATFTGGEVLFVDAQGRPASVFLEGTRAYLRVVDHGYSGTVPVTVTAELSGDLESVTLQERSPGVFEGSVELRSEPSGFPQNGTLETSQASGPPHEFETLRVVYEDPSGSSTATASTLNFRIWFLDAYGSVVSSYVQGSRVYVRVEDHNLNDPGLIDRLYVDLYSSAGDQESLELTETGEITGIYEGSILLSNATTIPSDGALQAQAGGEITAHRSGIFVFMPARAQIELAAISFIDGAGVPTVELLENGTARVRVTSPGHIGTPSLQVQLRAFHTGDQEDLILTATGQETGVFEGSISLSLNASASSGNGVLETGNQGPEYLGEQVTATFGPFSATARTVGSRVELLNLRGQPVTSYSLGAPVRVRVEAPSRDQSPVADSFLIQVHSLAGDQEDVTMTETSPTSGIFVGSVPSVTSIGPSGDGVLSAGAGDVVEARVPLPNAPTYITARATFLANHLPQAVDDVAEVIEGQIVIVPVVSNDSDPDPLDQLRIASFTQGAKGTVELLTTNSLAYAPNAGETGQDTFTYFVTDSQGGEAAATVTVTIIPSNRPPVANDDVASVDEDGTVDIVVIANDTDPENPLTVESVTQGANGSVVINPDQTVTYTPVASYNGSDTFTYTVNDGNGESDTATVTVTITPVNDAPVANADIASVAEDGTVDVAVLANDTDLDGGTLTVASVTQGTNGAVTVNPDNTVKYTPSSNYSGTDSFTYTVSDGNGGSATATVSVTITAVNDAPVANADAASVDEDNPVTVAVLANDTDPEGNTLTVTGTSHQGAVVNADNTVTFAAGPNNFGVYTFNYTVSDGQGGTATGTVTVTVNEVNDPPVAVADAATADEDELAIITLLANDSDVENDALTVTSITQPANGTATLRPNGTVEYLSNTNYNGPDSFTYTVTDARGASATATVSVTVRPRNDAPVGNPDTASVAEDGSVDIPVLANDTDLDGDTLGLSVTSQGANGTASPQPDGTIRYTPEANFHGTASFTYRATDNRGGTTAVTTVTVTVTPVNDAPVANADTASVAEDGNVDVTVLSNDTDPENDTLTVTAVTQGTNGAVSINPDKTVKYTPSANYNGSDSFTYTVSDGNGGTATATVTVTVTAVNDAPVANADTASVAEDGNVNVTVLANDTDPENNALTVTAVTQGTNGAVTINPDNTVKYTPASSYNGSDSFTYTASDSNGGTSTATVTVTVAAVNDAPVANADTASVAEDGTVNVAVLSNDTDADNDTLNVTSVTQGAHGAVLINPDKTVKYTPAANYNGPDSFTYTVSDGNGGTATATVTVTVTSGNDAPTANADAASVAEDGAVNVAVLANDSDPENDTLNVTSVTQGAHGTVSINPDKTVRYAPALNYSGPDSFTYTVSDGNGGTATAAVTMTVTAVNDAPVAVNDTATVVAGSAVTIPVLANDTDVDGPSLTVTAVTQGSSDTIVINGGQTVTYTAGLFVGTDSFTYTVSDGAGGTANATVTVTVTAPPRVTTNLQVRYNFSEGSGSTVTDTSGVGTPLNLTISPTSAVSWQPGALSVNATTIISSAGAATKVINAVRSSSAITVEAWVAADNLTQTGPARIVSINKNGAQSNIIFGQAANRYETRTSTSSGTRTQQTPVNSVSTSLKHVVYTRNSGGLTVTYIDGVQVASTTATGSLSNWDTTMRLALANAIGGGSPWRGDLDLVAIYSRSLTATEVQQNFLAGANAN